MAPLHKDGHAQGPQRADGGRVRLLLHKLVRAKAPLHKDGHAQGPQRADGGRVRLLLHKLVRAKELRARARARGADTMQPDARACSGAPRCMPQAGFQKSHLGISG